MIRLYRELVNNYSWSLTDIDNTDFETLIDFMTMEDKNPNERVINGKVYKRAQGVPKWL